MRFLYKIFGLVSFILICASPSHACRVMRPPEAKIALGGFNAVVVGRVTQARYTGEMKYDSHPWEGTIRLETVVKGDVKQDTIPIYRSGSSAACDDGQPVPPEGQPWVVYLSGQDLTFRVVYSFPLLIACQADQTLPETACKGLPRSDREE